MDDPWNINPWLAMARFTHFGSCLLLFGMCVFDRFIVIADDNRQWQAIFRFWLLLAIPAALLSGIIWFICVASDMSGLPLRDATAINNLCLVWNQTHFGEVWKIRAAIWLATAVTAMATVFAKRKLVIWPILISSGSLLASLAWAGHGQLGPNAGWHLPADSVHLLVAGFWPTGLLPLTHLLLKIRPTSFDIRRLIRRFSAMSLASVAVLAITGLVNSYYLVGSFANIWPMVYGRVLLIKIGVFCLMIMFGAINLLYLKPRLSRCESEHFVAAKLQISVGFELVLGILVVALVAILGLMPPARM